MKFLQIPSWKIKDVLGGMLKSDITTFVLLCNSLHATMLKIPLHLLPCQMMETLNMVLSCVDLVRMGKILDT